MANPRLKWWRVVRTKVLFSAITLAAAAVVFAGVVAYSLERNRLEATAEAELFAQYESSQMMSSRSRDPNSGEPFTDAAATAQAIVENNAVQPALGSIALGQGQVLATSRSTTGNDLRSDTEFQQQVLTLPEVGPRVRTISTASGTYEAVIDDVTMGDDTARIAFAYSQRALYSSINETYQTYVVVAVGAIILFGFVTWVSISRLLAPIRVMQRTVRRVNDTGSSNRVPVHGNDDLTDLAVNINAMLDRLAKTFEDQRAFHDDISHELRTPLTIVRGHLEVLDAQDPDDVRATKARAISELDRINLLVEDMMTLAKSLRPDFANVEPTNAGELTDDVFEKARALGDRRWTLEHIVDTEVVLDPRRIEQALLELCRNAVKFTEEGDVVAMGSDATGQKVRFWVRDEGIGVPAEQIPHLTKRHVRGGQATRKEGQGLGLAIVESIVTAHGGRLIITSEVGVGTTVTMELPTPPGG